MMTPKVTTGLTTARNSSDFSGRERIVTVGFLHRIYHAAAYNEITAHLA
jgi:hypothetical protein